MPTHASSLKATIGRQTVKDIIPAAHNEDDAISALTKAAGYRYCSRNQEEAFLSAPAQRPRAATCRRSPTTGRRAEAPPLRALPPARSCHGVRPRLRESTVAAARSLRRLSSPRPSVSPLTRSASGSGLSQPPTLTRGLLHVNHNGAPGPRVTPSQRLQRPALWGIRACVVRVARAVTRRPWAAGGGRTAGRGPPVTA